MSDPDDQARAFDEIRRRKPQLVGFFQTSLECLSRLTRASHEDVDCIRKLTYASEYLFIHAEVLFPRLLARGELGLFSDLLFALTGLDRGASQAFLSRYPALDFPLGKIEGELRFFAASCGGRIKGSDKALAAILALGEAEKCSFLLSQCGVVAQYSPGTLLEGLALFKAKLPSLPWERLQSWLSRATDFFTSNRTDDGAQFLLLRTKESRSMLGITSLALEDLKSVITIYCASLCGYDMVISSLDSSLFALKRLYTDGTSIFLPPEVNFFTQPVYNERVYTALAAEQAASVSMGSFSLDLGAIDFMDELRERYALMLPRIADNVRRQYGAAGQTVRERADGEIEVVFPSNKKLLVMNTEHEKLFYSFPTPDFAKELFTLIENARIERRLSALYPGLREDFALLNSYLWNKRPRVSLEAGAEREASFFAAVECLVQFSLIGRHKAEIQDPDLTAVIQSILSEFRAIDRADVTVQDTARILFRVYNVFYDHFPVVSSCSKSDIRSKFPGSAKPEFFPEIVRDATPELFREESAGAPAEEKEEPSEERKAIDLGSFRQAERKLDDIRQAISDGAMKVYRYPEYSCLTSGYMKNHCTLFESVLASRESEYYAEVVRQYALVNTRIRKRFLHMKPEELEMSRRWLSGEEINLSDALDYTIALIRGESLDEKIYDRKIRSNRDVMVCVLVDASSSTDTSVGSMRVIDVEKAALSLLASALDLIGDPFGLFSFYSLGRQRVFVNVIKDFDEAWGAETQGRIPSIKPQASNRDGCAIRHATARLQKHQARTKLLILLSDGIPADPGYGSPSGSETSRYAIEDTRRAILECRRQGVIPYCLTIDRYAKKYVSYLYGVHHAILSDVTRLPEKLSQLYLRLTR
jgi:nitric oxide reductase NorD protein